MKTITNAQIRTLRTEARAAGDDVTAAYCELALAYTETADVDGADLLDPISGEAITRTEARAVCADAINAAAAMG